MKTIRRRTAAALSLLTVPAATASRDLVDPVIRRAAEGDRNAIGLLGRQLRDQLVAAAARDLENDGDAEDVVQDLFVLMLERSLEPPAADEPALGWLLRTVACLVEEHDGRDDEERDR